MSVVVESFSVAGFTVNPGPYIITKPAGVVDGNLLLWFVDFEDETGGPLAGPTILTPPGWAPIGGSNNFGNYHSWAAFFRAASGEPSSYVMAIAAPESNDCGMIMLRLSGHDPGAPINAFGNIDTAIVSASPLVAPSVLTTEDGCAIFRVGGDGRAVAPTCPAGTSSVAFVDVTFGASLRACRDVADLTPFGATGAATFGLPDTFGSRHALTLAIAPLISGHGGMAGSSPAVLAQAGRERIQRAVAMLRRDFWEESRR